MLIHFLADSKFPFPLSTKFQGFSKDFRISLFLNFPQMQLCKEENEKFNETGNLFFLLTMDVLESTNWLSTENFVLLLFCCCHSLLVLNPLNLWNFLLVQCAEFSPSGCNEDFSKTDSWNWNARQFLFRSTFHSTLPIFLGDSALLPFFAFFVEFGFAVANWNEKWNARNDNNNRIERDIWGGIQIEYESKRSDCRQPDMVEWGLTERDKFTGSSALLSLVLSKLFVFSRAITVEMWQRVFCRMYRRVEKSCKNRVEG